ncbi:hypothetical protein FHS40_009270, partial [Streptomyces spectabilis]
PKGRFELPDDAVAHLGRQVKVADAELGFYDFTGRTAKAHRKEIREATGFHPCTVADAKALAAWLAVHIAQEERRVEQVRAQLLAHCRTERIEPPTAERVARIVDSGIRQADDRLIAAVAGRLHAAPAAALEALVSADTDEEEPAEAAPRTEGTEENTSGPDTDVLSDIKASPGNVSLATALDEITKLEAVRAIGLPPDLFAGIHPKVVTAWRCRAAVESPSHLRTHPQPIRLVLLAALVHQRTCEITDTLVDLLNSIVHKINARAERSSPRSSPSATRRSATRAPSSTRSPRSPWNPRKSWSRTPSTPSSAAPRASPTCCTSTNPGAAATPATRSASSSPPTPATTAPG